MDNKLPIGKNQGQKRKWIKNIGFLVIVGIIAAVFLISYKQPSKLTERSYNSVINSANKGEISKLEINGDTITVTKKGDSKATEKTVKQPGADLYDSVGGLTNREVTVTFKPSSSSGATWTALAINLLP
ncbi:MAG: hypothetical protein M0R39_17400, partial [Prolixibacteraceae bacterium]|nr:hypothetical protein [Prolixibacteraceae bacterium]